MSRSSLTTPNPEFNFTEKENPVMELKKGSFLFKVAYGLTPDKDIPSRTSLCRLFWRVILMIFMGWPVGTVVIAVVIACISIFGFLTARRIPFFKGEKAYGDENTIPFKSWPTVAGHRILPGVVLAIVAFASLVYLYGKMVVSAIFGFVVSLMARVSEHPLLLTIGIGVIVLVALSIAVKKSGLWDLTKNFVRAKLIDKICPMVDIVQ